MRISTNMSLDNFITQQQKLSGSFYGTQQKLSTGRAILLPSDGPVQASRMLKLSEIEESQGQVLENIRFARDFLSSAEGALGDVTSAVIRAQELASGAVSSVALPAEREAAAIEIDSIVQQLMTTANRQFLSLYLFGGRDVKTPPLVSDLDGIRYTGDTGDLTSRVAFDGDEAFNITADAVFGLLSSGQRGSVDLDPMITADTRLDELAGANLQGIRLGSLRFAESGSAGTFSVDVTAATSVGQLIDLINRAAEQAGSGLRASINAAGTGIAINPGDAVSISALDNGAVAADLGIVTTAPTNAVIEGRDLNRLLANNTPVSVLFGGQGLTVEGASFRIINGTHEAIIDLGPVRTVEDIINTINNANIGVRAVINSDRTGIDVLNEVSGSVMSITEDGGTAAADLGIRTFDATSGLSDLNFGIGVRTVDGVDDFRIVGRDGTVVDVNLDGAQTVQEVIDLINQAAADAGAALTASLPGEANGIRIVDDSGGAGRLQLQRLNFSEALSDLGLDQTLDPAATEVTGRDVSGIRVEGLFSALLDMRDALVAGNERDITAAAGRVDVAFGEISRIQGLLGAEVRSIESRAEQTRDAVDATRVLLSEVRDLDYTEAITRFQQTQTALQASLLASGQSLNLSLLNFLS